LANVCSVGVNRQRHSDEAPVCEIQKDENNDVFVLVAGMKIAKRGLAGTAQADTWIMLEPGWMVRDIKGGTAIEVRWHDRRNGSSSGSALQPVRTLGARLRRNLWNGSSSESGRSREGPRAPA
jgi:hypothetical protein